MISSNDGSDLGKIKNYLLKGKNLQELAIFDALIKGLRPIEILELRILSEDEFGYEQSRRGFPVRKIFSIRSDIIKAYVDSEGEKQLNDYVFTHASKKMPLTKLSRILQRWDKALDERRKLVTASWIRTEMAKMIFTSWPKVPDENFVKRLSPEMIHYYLRHDKH